MLPSHEIKWSERRRDRILILFEIQNEGVQISCSVLRLKKEQKSSLHAESSGRFSAG